MYQKVHCLVDVVDLLIVCKAHSYRRRVFFLSLPNYFSIFPLERFLERLPERSSNAAPVSLASATK